MMLCEEEVDVDADVKVCGGRRGARVDSDSQGRGAGQQH